MFDFETAVKITLFGLCGVFVTLRLLMAIMEVIGRILKNSFKNKCVISLPPV
jgi:Na+-transporting methylmalonyl-CoA/oxaloacetate decarboxylase gamma subunit